MYQLVFYVPKSHVDVVKGAVFEAGAGRIGNYDCCCWQTEGTGQFRPLPGSRPFLGREDEVEQVAEVKVEMVLEDASLDEVRAALVAAHPYEEPAYAFLPLAN